MTVIRPLALAELARAVEIDVTEDGTLVLEQDGATIRIRAEEWHRPPRSRSRWMEFVARWRTFIPEGGMAFGALEPGDETVVEMARDRFEPPVESTRAVLPGLELAGDRLVGIATLRRSIRPRIDQLEALFVDRAHRRRGIARDLVDAVARAARAGGATRLYVSATPSESAVGLYMSRGFRPTTEPVPELLALEPDDVHMILDLTRSADGADPTH